MRESVQRFSAPLSAPVPFVQVAQHTSFFRTLTLRNLAILSNSCQTPSTALRRGTLRSERYMAQFTIRAESNAFQAHSRTVYDPLSPQVEIYGQEEWVEMMCQRADSRCFISLGLFDSSARSLALAPSRDRHLTRAHIAK